MEDHFALLWRGSIRCGQTGDYGFSVLSDDAVELLIDGRVVVADRESHAPRTTRGVASLTAGDHRFEVRFLEGTGAQACAVSWAPPGEPEAIVPASAFSHEGRERVPPPTAIPLPDRKSTRLNSSH